jgi:hypothetical protein
VSIPARFDMSLGHIRRSRRTNVPGAVPGPLAIASQVCGQPAAAPTRRRRAGIQATNASWRWPLPHPAAGCSLPVGCGIRSPLRLQTTAGYSLHAMSADGKEDRALFRYRSKSCSILNRPGIRAGRNCHSTSTNGRAPHVRTRATTPAALADRPAGRCSHTPHYQDWALQSQTTSIP